MDTACSSQDTLLVCRNGHVITDRLHSCPEQYLSHCDRCGAATLYRCLTCGQELPGALRVPGPVPVGTRRPPQFCEHCGATFPWTLRPRPVPPLNSTDVLEALLRRLPAVARQLRFRQNEQPPFRVEDQRDLEDLVRALLAVRFDDVATESRTPHYAPGTRTDFLLDSGALALSVKYAAAGLDEARLTAQLQEDVAHYQRRAGCSTLVCLVYDPEGLLPDPGQREAVYSRLHDALNVRCVIVC